jgi:hypothetical protein
MGYDTSVSWKKVWNLVVRTLPKHQRAFTRHQYRLLFDDTDENRVYDGPLPFFAQMMPLIILIYFFKTIMQTLRLAENGRVRKSSSWKSFFVSKPALTISMLLRSRKRLWNKELARDHFSKQQTTRESEPSIKADP